MPMSNLHMDTLAVFGMGMRFGWILNALPRIVAVIEMPDVEVGAGSKEEEGCDCDAV